MSGWYGDDVILASTADAPLDYSADDLIFERSADPISSEVSRPGDIAGAEAHLEAFSEAFAVVDTDDFVFDTEPMHVETISDFDVAEDVLAIILPQALMTQPREVTISHKAGAVFIAIDVSDGPALHLDIIAENGVFQRDNIVFVSETNVEDMAFLG